MNIFCNFSRKTTLLSYNPDQCKHRSVWALPVSLAATKGMLQLRCIFFFSSRYWDVSLPWVRICTSYVCKSSRFARWSFLIRKSSDQRLLGTSPKRIAASRVLHRHVEPRHPPYALNKFPIRKSRNHFSKKFLQKFFGLLPALCKGGTDSKHHHRW